ncbi:hypothetical protein BMS3Bbin04_00041 [bacterium BMS3Bbin04]|nr:hypothetical protein BMS3Bbin04_00041 [bacterium BMS3Bbin04]
MLPSEIYTQYPFSELDSLGDSIEERILEEPSVSQAPEKLPWLTAIGAELCRVNLNSEEDTLRIHNLADQLRESELLVISGLETIPYIDGTPVGTQRRITAFWKDRRLFVEDLSAPRMAMAVARELGRVFAQSEINDAIKLCYDRSPEFISEYMEENFELVPGVDVDQRVNNIKSEEKIAVGHNTIENGKATEVESSNRKTGEDGTPVSSENKGEVEEVIVGKDAGDEQDGIDSGNVRLPQRLQKSAKGMISFIERFAKAQGYFNDGKDRFIHEDGSWIARESVVQSFPWERRSSLGELLKCYCIKEHCLERGPLQLDADVWRLCYKYPNKYSLLLQDDDDEPLEVTGLRLMDMREKGKLLIYPAKYRLVYKSSDQ